MRWDARRDDALDAKAEEVARRLRTRLAAVAPSLLGLDQEAAEARLRSALGDDLVVFDGPTLTRLARMMRRRRNYWVNRMWLRRQRGPMA